MNQDPITHDQEIFGRHMRESYRQGVWNGIITTLIVLFALVVVLVMVI